MENKKVAVITGGSGGIGFACCREFSKKGFKVYEISRRDAENGFAVHIKGDRAKTRGHVFHHRIHFSFAASLTATERFKEITQSRRDREKNLHFSLDLCFEML